MRKSWRLIGLCARSLSCQDVQFMTGVYFLNYASCKWSPNLRREINEVELVQRSFMKKIRNLRDLMVGD